MQKGSGQSDLLFLRQCQKGGKNGVTKIVSEVAWQDAKRIRSIRPLNPKINIKNGLKTRKMVIFYHLFYIFSGARGLLDLIPFASCQSTSCTSLEYPHGILWWNLKITIFGHPGPFRRWFLGVKPHFQSKMTKIKTVIWSKMANKTEVESVQLGNTYIADMDKCPQDKCCLDKCPDDSCNLLYMFPGPFA